LLNAGLLPFLPGDLIKSSLASVAFPAAWAAAKRLRGGDA
jgi:biotin transporter BioY